MEGMYICTRNVRCLSAVSRSCILLEQTRTLWNKKTLLNHCRYFRSSGFRFKAGDSRGSDEFGSIQRRRRAKELERCYLYLGLTSSCSKTELKNAYLFLVKRYHPDSGHADTDAEKFQKVKESYKFIVDNDYAEEEREELEEVATGFDIRHTAPQHRQYLEYGGVGSGTPSQRQRQYQQHRFRKAAENVSEFMVGKILTKEQEDTLMTVKTRKDAEYARKWKTRSGMDRLVDDLIQEAMRNGEFDKLSGMGKPLKTIGRNPYVDTTTHKLNEILFESGFRPRWVLMEKEMRDEIRRIRSHLLSERKKFPSNESEWNREEISQWSKTIDTLTEDCIRVNKLIDNFNLVAPAVNRQVVHLLPARELKRLEKTLTAGNESSTSESGNNLESGADRIISDAKSKSVINRHSDDSAKSVFRTLLEVFNIK